MCWVPDMDSGNYQGWDWYYQAGSRWVGAYELYPWAGPFAVQGPLAPHWPGPPAISSVPARLLRAFSPAEKKIAALLRPVWERCFSQNTRATVLYYTQSRWALVQGPTFVLFS